MEIIVNCHLVRHLELRIALHELSWHYLSQIIRENEVVALDTCARNTHSSDYGMVQYSQGLLLLKSVAPSLGLCKIFVRDCSFELQQMVFHSKSLRKFRGYQKGVFFYFILLSHKPSRPCLQLSTFFFNLTQYSGNGY